MTDDDRIRRRTMLRVAGATVSVGALAGCLEESSVDDGSVGNGDDDSSDDDSSEPSGSEPDEPNDDGSSEGDSSGEEDGPSDDDSNDNEPNDEDDSRTDFGIDPDERIVFEGLTTGFEGIEPKSIEAEVNPTLNLREGETYEIGWIQGDGGNHNLVIWDEDERLVEDYQSGDSEYETTDNPGDGDFVEFEASEETVYYRCYPHSSMHGAIRVE